MLLKDKAVINGSPSRYHLHSSIWSNIKNEYITVISNSSSLIGNGPNTKFWMDSLCGSPLNETIHHNLINQVNIDSYGTDYLIDGVWNFTKVITSFLPNINLFVDKVTLPLDITDDYRVHNHNAYGDLSLKETFVHKLRLNPSFTWFKHL